MADGDVIDVWDLPQYITGKVIENKQPLINPDVDGSWLPLMNRESHNRNGFRKV